MPKLRARTILAIASEDFQPPDAHKPFDEPFLVDLRTTDDEFREWLFAIQESDVASVDEASARGVAQKLFDKQGVGAIFETGKAAIHILVAGRWVEYGSGFVFPLLDLRVSPTEPWGELLRSDDTLWLRASVVVEKV